MQYLTVNTLQHDESERRHQEQLDQRKEKAVELSLGKFSLTPTTGQQVQGSPIAGNKIQSHAAVSSIKYE